MHVRYTFATLAAAAVLGIVGGSQSIAASPSDPMREPVSVRINYGDLDLGTDAGAKAMLDRISHAARNICGEEDRVGIESRSRYYACLKTTVDRAVAKLGVSRVTALNGGPQSAGQVVLATARP
jgi:UrcA family protein